MPIGSVRARGCFCARTGACTRRWTTIARVSRVSRRSWREWLVDRGVWLVGLEMPSVASLQDKEELTTVHQILLRGEVVIVECLANLDKLPPEVTFVALPLKIESGDGSPIRAIAIA